MTSIATVVIAIFLFALVQTFALEEITERDIDSYVANHDNVLVEFGDTQCPFCLRAQRGFDSAQHAIDRLPNDNKMVAFYLDHNPNYDIWHLDVGGTGDGKLPFIVFFQCGKPVRSFWRGSDVAREWTKTHAEDFFAENTVSCHAHDDTHHEDVHHDDTHHEDVHHDDTHHDDNTNTDVDPTVYQKCPCHNPCNCYYKGQCRVDAYCGSYDQTYNVWWKWCTDADSAMCTDPQAIQAAQNAENQHSSLSAGMRSQVSLPLYQKSEAAEAELATKDISPFHMSTLTTGIVAAGIAALAALGAVVWKLHYRSLESASPSPTI